MISNIKKTIFILLALCLALNLEAKVRLPRLISDGMVLQRDTDIKIWGWADPKETVTVKFGGASYKTKADAKGNWSVMLPPQKAGAEYSIQINDIIINDVLFGDVWLCSGQSNMELPMRRVLDLYANEVSSANNANIRYFKVPLKYDFVGAQTDIEYGTWEVTTPETILDFSAVAYFFAKELYEKNNVPIGLINASVGGSPAEAWISQETIKKYPTYEAEANKLVVEGYIESIRKDEKAKGDAWYTLMAKSDKDIDVYNDTSKWDSYYLPGLWKNKLKNIGNNVVWLRKEFDVAKEDAGKPAILRLGYIIDSDSAFINRHFVGTTGYQYPPRIYPVGEQILQAGKNRVTVRVVTNANGGFQEDKPYKIIMGDKTINLTGEWEYKVGEKLPPPSSTTFFQYKPTGLYNAMIAPINNYKLKGVIWYQGESNLSKTKEYAQLFQDMIKDWRAKRDEPELSFIFAQLPNMNEPWKKPTESAFAELREAQQEALTLPATGMAVTLGLGEWNDIHPLNKKDVGRLLALEAQRVAYKNDLLSPSPSLESFIVKDNSVILTFSGVGEGLCSNQLLDGFTIAGTDGKQVWAKASVIAKDKVRVWSSEVTHPMSVRYAWADNPVGANLMTKEGLRVSSFRTDK